MVVVVDDAGVDSDDDLYVYIFSFKRMRGSLIFRFLSFLFIFGDLKNRYTEQ